MPIVDEGGKVQGPISYHSIRVPRPYDLVVEQLLSLDRRWLKVAALTAVSAEGVRPLRGGRHVEVRVGAPVRAGDVLGVPLEWVGAEEGEGARIICVLEIRPTGGCNETQLTLRISAVGWASSADLASSGGEVAHYVAKSLLQRLYWTLLVLCQSRSSTLNHPCPAN